MRWCHVLNLQQTRTQEWSSCSVSLCVTSLPDCPATTFPHCDGSVFMCVIALSAAMYLRLLPLQLPCGASPCVDAVKGTSSPYDNLICP